MNVSSTMVIVMLLLTMDDDDAALGCSRMMVSIKIRYDTVAAITWWWNRRWRRVSEWRRWRRSRWRSALRRCCCCSSGARKVRGALDDWYDDVWWVLERDRNNYKLPLSMFFYISLTNDAIGNELYVMRSWWWSGGSNRCVSWLTDRPTRRENGNEDDSAGD